MGDPPGAYMQQEVDPPTTYHIINHNIRLINFNKMQSIIHEVEVE